MAVNVRPTMRNEVHICTAPNGHHLSTDCWCEPTHINWMTNKHGIKVLVVEHHDETLMHRIMVLAKRNSGKVLDTLNTIRHADAPWVTRLLDEFAPPTPNDEHNERSI